MGRSETYPRVEEEEMKRMEVEAREKVAGGGRNRRRKIARGERNAAGQGGVWRVRATRDGGGGSATCRHAIGCGRTVGPTWFDRI